MARSMPLAAAVLMAALAGCAGKQEPLLSLGEQACDGAPMMDSAVPVALGRSATATLGSAGHCLLHAGAPLKVTYALFRLPSSTEAIDVTISSLATGGVLVAPELTVLDDAGEPGRTLASRNFQSGIAGLSAGLRLRDGERFLLVTADPALLGQPATLRLSLRQQGGVDTAAVIFVPIILPGPQAARTQQKVTYGLNGVIRVTANPAAVIR